jgi:hypothetical protein
MEVRRGPDNHHMVAPGTMAVPEAPRAAYAARFSRTTQREVPMLPKDIDVVEGPLT